MNRSTLIDGRGVPLAVNGANVPDQKLTTATLDEIPFERPEPTPDEPQHLCFDKEYAGEHVDRVELKRG